MTELALEKLQAGKPVETLHLSDVVLAFDPKNGGALHTRIKALEELREHCENYVEDGWLQYGIRKAKQSLDAH